MISKKARIGKNVKIGCGVVIDDEVSIGDNVRIDDYARILNGVSIGENSFIGAFSTLGEPGIYTENHKVGKITIGKNALIRSHSIIYHSNKIGSNFQTGHRVSIRENSEIGNNVRIGTVSDIQGNCQIGNYVNLHSNVHIGQKSVIEDFVWIFPYVVLTNDPTPPSNTLLGVRVKKFAAIATGAILLPGVIVGEDALVGACTLVNRNVDDKMIVVGNPMKQIGDVSRIKDKTTGKTVYPWKFNFERGMPWEGIGYAQWEKQQNLVE